MVWTLLTSTNLTREDIKGLPNSSSLYLISDETNSLLVSSVETIIPSDWNAL
jgi:hypothetical protein